MKNCPWFSLCSNSIESRFRSIHRGNFLVNISVNLKKAKATRNSLRSSYFFTRFARSRLKFLYVIYAYLNFRTSLVDTRSIHPT